MKKLIIAAALVPALTLAIACQKTARKVKVRSTDTSCGIKDGKTLHKDEQHNCYYLNESGLKEYVDNSNCSCI